MLNLFLSRSLKQAKVTRWETQGSVPK